MGMRQAEVRRAVRRDRRVLRTRAVPRHAGQAVLERHVHAARLLGRGPPRAGDPARRRGAGGWRRRVPEEVPGADGRARRHWRTVLFVSHSMPSDASRLCPRVILLTTAALGGRDWITRRRGSTCGESGGGRTSESWSDEPARAPGDATCAPQDSACRVDARGEANGPEIDISEPVTWRSNIGMSHRPEFRPFASLLFSMVKGLTVHSAGLQQR